MLGEHFLSSGTPSGVDPGDAERQQGSWKVEPSPIGVSAGCDVMLIKNNVRIVGHRDVDAGSLYGEIRRHLSINRRE
jgi:hypothetical protein